MSKPKQILISAIIFIGFCGVCFGEQILNATKTDTPPVIDGNAGDIAWEKAARITTTDLTVPDQPVHITLKAVCTDQRLFILAIFNDKDESRLHKPWIWNKNENRYVMGPEREDRFVIKWSMAKTAGADLSVFADQEYSADIWFWKAHRTDPTGYADDKIQILSRTKNPKAQKIISRSGTPMFLTRKGDQGKAAYKTKLYFERTQDQLPQYLYAQPQGSRGDIRAKGHWAENRWTIEFERMLDTGNSDDVKIRMGTDTEFGVSVYEIAGRKPDRSVDVPHFGSGDVFERLILRMPK